MVNPLEMAIFYSKLFVYQRVTELWNIAIFKYL